MNNLIQLYNTIKQGRKTPDYLDLSHSERLFEFENVDIPLDNFQSLLRFLNDNIEAIKHIKRLSLRTNQLSQIPNFVFSLKELRELDLQRNRIEIISSQIEQLEELTYLDISDNHLADLPIELLELRKLKILNIFRNEIEKLPEDIHKLTNLESLIAHNNLITQIPKSILRLKKLARMRLNDNPIRNISPAIYTQGNGIDAYRIYNKSLEGGSSIFFGGKIIVVGDAGVGKSTLVENLEEIAARVSIDSTLGLNVKGWKLYSAENDKNINFRIWDFGGQGKYRTVQQLFCTPNTIYLYVTVPDALKKYEKYGSYLYWLNFVKVLGDNSPVVFIVNKNDKEKEENSFINEASIKKQFPFVRRFVKTSFKNSRTSKSSVGEIIQAIEDCISFPHNNDIDQNHSRINLHPLPNKWQSIIKRINKIKQEEDYISKDQFTELCILEKISDSMEQSVLLNFLNKSGVLLVYNSRITRCFKFHIILNPNWIRKAVYRVLDYLKEKDQIWFGEQDMKYIWKDYMHRQDYYSEVAELMKELNFSFKIYNRHYIPSLLPTYTYESNGDNNKSEVKYSYECIFSPYIPAGLMHRLVATNISLIDIKDGLWENRVLFYWKTDNSKVELLEKWNEGKLIFNVYNESLDTAKTFSNEIKKALTEFDARNSISEISIQERIEYDNKSWLLDEARRFDSVIEKNITNIYNEMKIKKFSNTGILTIIEGNITINSTVLDNKDKRTLQHIIEKLELTEDNQKRIINSFETIKSDKASKNEKKASVSFIKSLINSVSSEAGKQAIKLLFENGTDYIQGIGSMVF